MSFSAKLASPPPGFSPANSPCVTFDRSVSPKEQERLTNKWRLAMQHAEQENVIEAQIAEVYKNIDESAVSKIARQIIAPLIPENYSRCAKCDVPCVFQYETSISPLQGDKGNEQQRKSIAALDFAKSYVNAALKRRKFGPNSPTAAVSRYIEAIVINFYRRHDNGLGVYCPNKSCWDKRDIVFKRVSSSEAHADAQLVETVQNAIGAAKTAENDAGSVVVETCNSVSDKYVDLLGNVIEKEKKVPYTPLATSIAKAMPFSRCHYVEIMQAPFIIMFVRYTGNEVFVNACVECVKSRSVPANVRMMYQCDLRKARLLCYGEVLKQTQFYIDSNFEANNIHHFVHPIEATFDKKFVVESNRNLLQIFQATRRHWASQLNASQRKSFDDEYRQQKKKHEASNTVVGTCAQEEYRRSQQQKRHKTTPAPTVVAAAHRSKLQNDRTTKLISECRQAIHCFANWIWSKASDSVRCESVILKNDLVFAFGNIAPFVLFVVGYFNLIERNVDVDKVRKGYFDPLKSLFVEAWDSDLQILYSIASPQHVAEQRNNQRNMIGFIASQKSLVLLISQEALYSIELFLSLRGDNTSLLRAMLSGTFVTLRQRPLVGRSDRKRKNSVDSQVVSVFDVEDDTRTNGKKNRRL